MYYNIGQISEMFEIPVSTLRYYDKEGLFPNMERASGIRKFSEREIEQLRLIECLKKSGLEIKNIKLFMEWCAMESSTYEQRHELFVEQRKNVMAEIDRLNNVLDMINFKCWYYEQAIKDGSEKNVNPPNIKNMPKDIQKAYLNTHEAVQ